MDDYQTEEEQVESIKKWWAENSRSIIFGVGLGLFAIFGWQSWKDQTHSHALEASNVYQQMVRSIKDSQVDAAILLADEIDTSYADTPYAALAGLQKAKLLNGKGDKAAAIESLEKVAASDGNESLRHVARVRAYRMRIGNGDMQGVITDIDSVMAEEGGINPGEFIGKYEELKGDAYRLLDDVEQARYGYIAALRTATLDRRLVQLKLDDLGPPPAKFAGENNETTKEESE